MEEKFLALAFWPQLVSIVEGKTRRKTIAIGIGDGMSGGGYIACGNGTDGSERATEHRSSTMPAINQAGESAAQKAVHLQQPPPCAREGFLSFFFVLSFRLFRLLAHFT